MAQLAGSHPQIHCDGELFNREWGYVRTDLARHLLIRYPFPYLEWRRRKAAAPAYGFKLMAYHLARPRAAMQRLARDGWLIVHVRRRNRLHQSLSKLIAEKTGHWHTRRGDPPPAYRVRIGIAELNEELATREAWTRSEEAAIEGLPRLSVDYEGDLAEPDCWAPTMQRFFRHIGVPPAPISTELRRTDERDYAQIIENHPELLAALAHGPHRRYLAQA